MMRGSTIPEPEQDATFQPALKFSMNIYKIAVRRWGDLNTLPFLHTFLVFMHHMSRYPAGMMHLEEAFPWKLTAVMLNYLYHTCKFELRIDSD
jgi:hypothetical protein